jgi:pentatricopeptide repeat protein
MRLPEAKDNSYPYSLMMEAYANSHYLRGPKDTSNDIIASGEKIWSRMLEAGIAPSVYSFQNRIRLYSQCYRLNRAVELKDEMKHKFGIAPVEQTYNILIRMFCHARRVERAFDQVNIMKAVDKLEPNKNTYIELLVGCTKEFYVQSGMKLLREMRTKNWLAGEANTQWVNDFRRQLVKFPWFVREIDEMTGKADIPVAPWRHPGVKRKIRYNRDLTPEEQKRSPLFR